MSIKSSIIDSIFDSIFDSIPEEETLGKIVQTTTFYTNSVVSGIPTPIAIPGVIFPTSGLQFFTVSHTAIKTSNLLDVFVITTFSTNANNVIGTVLLSAPAASSTVFAASSTVMQAANFPDSICFHTRLSPPSTSPVTFEVRGAASAAASISLNGILGVPIYAGTVATISGIKIYEIEP